MYIVYWPIDLYFLTQQMPLKKKQSLALSLKEIEAERVNMKLRTDQQLQNYIQTQAGALS